MKSYPHVHQIGFVVNDMEQAMDEYGKIYHIKKWYQVVQSPDDDMFFHGEKIDDPGYGMRIGYCGKTEIELITTAAEESIYANFLRDRGPGLHHISFFTKDLETSVKEYQSLGFEIVQNGFLTAPNTRTDYVYLAKPEEGLNHIVEFSASTLKGTVKITRSKALAGVACMLGSMIRVR